MCQNVITSARKWIKRSVEEEEEEEEEKEEKEKEEGKEEEEELSDRWKEEE